MANEMYKYLSKERYFRCINDQESSASGNTIIHHVQLQAYPYNISRLSNNQVLLKSSTCNLRSLMPRLDDEGLLVVSGCLKQAEMPLHGREPVPWG